MPKPKSGAFSRFFVSLIERRLEELRLSIHAAEKRYGFPPETLRSVIRGSSPSVDRFKQICDALQIDLSLGGGEGRGAEGGGAEGGEERCSGISSGGGSSAARICEGRELCLVGVVGAGAEVSYWDDRSTVEDRVSAPFSLSGGKGFVGVVVRGDSMEPVFTDGDMLFFDVSVSPQFETLLGKVCMIECADGSCFVKRVERGREMGKYNLESYNWRSPVLADVELRAARPVLWIKKA